MFRVIPDATTYRENVLLRDGQGIVLRKADPADVPAVEALMHDLSPQSLHLRFFGGVSHVSRSYIEFLCSERAPEEQATVLAIVGEPPEERVVGVGNYAVLPGSRVAEVSFVVDDAFQGRGVGTLLLERIAGVAAGAGFVGFVAEVLYENQSMLSVFRESGFAVSQALVGSTIHVDFPVDGAAAVRERAEVRERVAAANSLVPLLRPRTVAVIGASRDPTSMGGVIFGNILKSGFTGTVYPVNKQAPSVNGVKSYATIEEIADPVDLAVLVVPAAEVLAVAQQCLHKGVKALVVVSAGFAESGEEGAARQARLVEMVRAHGARLVGPNCMGVLNTDPAVSLNASLAPRMPPRGKVGVYSHSGALGVVILDLAAERGVGFSTFVSAGNRADVSGNALLQYWEEDPETAIVLLYLEGFGNPRRFARIARRLASRKAVLCVKSARSRAGLEAARAHIGAVAQSDVEVDALFRQTGVVRLDRVEEMFDVALLLANQPLPRGRSVAIVSNSGGVATICADACEAEGLQVAGPGAVDLGPLATVTSYERAVQEALVRDDVDALIAIFACVGSCDPDAVSRAIRRGVVRAGARTGATKTTLLCLMGRAGAVEIGRERVSSRQRATGVFPSFRFPEAAAFALARAVEVVALRATPPGRLLWYEEADAAGARRQVGALLEGTGVGGVVSTEGEAAAAFLACFGLEPRDCDKAGVPIELRVHYDPQFGPLISLRSDKGPAALRITPLTDRDARELAEGVSVLPSDALVELLGRVSQAIEEVPWLWALDANLVAAPGGEKCGVCLARGATVAFCRFDWVGAPPPSA